MKECKYQRECPHYQADSVRCSYFYETCKELRRELTQAEIDRIFDIVVKFQTTKQKPKLEDEVVLGVGSMM